MIGQYPINVSSKTYVTNNDTFFLFFLLSHTIVVCSTPFHWRLKKVLAHNSSYIEWSILLSTPQLQLVCLTKEVNSSFGVFCANDWRVSFPLHSTALRACYNPSSFHEKWIFDVLTFDKGLTRLALAKWCLLFISLPSGFYLIYLRVPFSQGCSKIKLCNMSAENWHCTGF